MNYVKQTRKILGPYFIYRGYSGKVKENGAVEFGDAWFESKAHFIVEIDRLCEARYRALTNSIEQTEKLFK